MFAAVTPACCLEINRTLHSGLAVFDSHGADVLNVHRAKQEIVDCGGWTTDQVMFIESFQVHMLEPDWDGFKGARPRDTHLGVGVHVVSVIAVLSDAGSDWGVMTNLLCKIFVILADQLVSFSQDWIEGLARPLIRALILSNTECCNVHYPLDWVLLFIS
jgi:hypothetical protein